MGGVGGTTWKEREVYMYIIHDHNSLYTYMKFLEIKKKTFLKLLYVHGCVASMSVYAQCVCGAC